jgi:predicted DNA-binding protein YlxM (UPF0122 family)
LGKQRIIEKETIEQMYWNQKLTLREIAKKLQTSQWKLIELMRSYGIPRRKRTKVNGLVKNQLQTDYLKGLPISELAKKYGVCKSTVWKNTKEIANRRPKQISPDAYEPTFETGYVLGVCYGDGYIRKNGYYVVLETHDSDFAKAFSEIVQKWSALKPSVSTYKRRTQAPNQKCQQAITEHVVCICSQKANALLSELYDELPACIKTDDMLGGFLSGLIDSDGTIYTFQIKNRGKTYDTGRITIYLDYKKPQLTNKISSLFHIMNLHPLVYHNPRMSETTIVFARKSDIKKLGSLLVLQIPHKRECLKKLLSVARDK